MSPFALPFLLALLTSVLATFLLARAAPRWGWTDAPSNDNARRKPQGRAVPVIGGAAILLGLVALLLAGGSLPVAGPRFLPGAPSAAAAAASLLAAFGVGLFDDLLPGGLRVRSKLFLQLAASLPVALAAGASVADRGDDAVLATILIWAAAVVLALNALNTFDNHDGALTAVSLVAFAATAPLLCAPFLGFLPFNLDARRRRNRGEDSTASATPTAYLGDAGSHLVGLLVLLAPGAWPALLLPSFDLFRLSVVRWRRGARPWDGDRLHLAHRLAAAGLGRTSVALILALVAAPAFFATVGDSRAVWSWAGPAITALAFIMLVLRTPDPTEEQGG